MMSSFDVHAMTRSAVESVPPDTMSTTGADGSSARPDAVPARCETKRCDTVGIENGSDRYVEEK